MQLIGSGYNWNAVSLESSSNWTGRHDTVLTLDQFLLASGHLRFPDFTCFLFPRSSAFYGFRFFVPPNQLTVVFHMEADVERGYKAEGRIYTKCKQVQRRRTRRQWVACRRLPERLRDVLALQDAQCS
eukprot:gene12994-biopygen6088